MEETIFLSHVLSCYVISFKVDISKTEKTSSAYRFPPVLLTSSQLPASYPGGKGLWEDVSDCG